MASLLLKNSIQICFLSLGLRKRAAGHFGYWAFRRIFVLYFPSGNMFCSNKITLAFRWRLWVNKAVRELTRMADRKHISKCGAQNINNSVSDTPTKPGKSKIQKPNNTNEVMEEEKSVDIHGMFETIMEKLGKLDSIDTRMKSLEQELKDVKDWITYVHAEVKDIKKESEQLSKSEGETKKKN